MKHPPPALAKLMRPKLFGVCRRERLFKLLDASRKHPIVWVCGPPGAGKTTLVASYIEARKLPAVWYRIDSGDGDAATFLHYLGLAVAQVSTRKHPPLPPLTLEYLPGLEGFVRRSLREAFARMPRPSILVLDGFQDLVASPQFPAALLAALDEVPEGVSLIVISRTEPGPDAVRHAASQRLVTLAWEDLRFTAEESQALLAHGADGGAIAALQEAAGGWAAGLVLLREHLRRAGEGAGTLNSASREAVFDYFAGEIFAGVPPDQQRMLIITALLPHVPAALAEEITGNPQAGKVLDQLRRRNLFVSRRVGSPPEYEFHALFREFLLARGRTLLSADERRGYVRRAAESLEAQQRFEDAFSLYRQGEDWPAVARLILREGSDLLAQGRWQTLADWLRALPGQAVENDPWLSYWLGMALMASDAAHARTQFERAHERFVETGNGDGQIRVAAAMAESYYIEFDDFTPLDKWIAVLERLLTETRRFLSPSVELQAFSSMLVAMFHRQPHHPLLPATAARALHMLEYDLDPNQKATTGAFLLNYYSWVGDFDDAERLIARLTPVLNRPDITPWKRMFWQVRLARHYALRGDARKTVEHFARAQSLIDTEGLISQQRILSAMQLYTDLSLDDVASTERDAARLRELLEPNRRFDNVVHHMGQAWLGLQRGDLTTAVKHAQSACSASAQTGLIGLMRLTLILLAEVHAEQGLTEGARACLESARTVAGSESANPLMEYRILLAEANLASLEGDGPIAQARLRAAFAQGARQGYLSNYLWLPRAMARLCVLALENGIEPEYARLLIRSHGLTPESPEVSEWAWPIRVRTLGRFSLVKDEQPVNATGKTQKRPLDMLKGLIALGGRDVDGASLMARLWPDAEGDSARVAFDTTLHRLRKVLGAEAALQLQDGKLTLSARHAWVDTWAFERLTGQVIDKLVQQGSETAAPDAATLALSETALRLYQGHFLERESDEPWMLQARARLKSRFFRLITTLGQRWEQAGRWDQAISLYLRGLELDNLAEDLYRRLIYCHRALGQHAEALNVYRRCRDMLSIVLGTQPSQETEALYRSLRPS